MKVPIRVELPADLSPEHEEQVRSALERGLESLHKAHDHDDEKPKTGPHRYVREQIKKTEAIYKRQMAKMIEEIQAVILE